MTTTIDNNQRIFWIQCKGWSNDKYFCNMADIVKCCKEIPVSQPYEIRHLWNYQFKKLSVKQVIALIEANQLDATFFKKKKQNIYE